MKSHKKQISHEFSKLPTQFKYPTETSPYTHDAASVTTVVRYVTHHTPTVISKWPKILCGAVAAGATSVVAGCGYYFGKKRCQKKKDSGLQPESLPLQNLSKTEAQNKGSPHARRLLEKSNKQKDTVLNI